VKPASAWLKPTSGYLGLGFVSMLTAWPVRGSRMVMELPSPAQRNRAGFGLI
jgi:hypothetical protein